MASTVTSVVEDWPGFVVPAWADPDAFGADALCLSPWRRASSVVVDLVVGALELGPRDLFVDLGSGDGSVVLGVASRTGCRGVGIEAAADLVGEAVAARDRAGIDSSQVVFLHELIGCRGLVGATVIYSWLLPPAAPMVATLVRDAARSGSLRAAVLVGGLLESIGSGDSIGRVTADAMRGPRGFGVAVSMSTDRYDVRVLCPPF